VLFIHWIVDELIYLDISRDNTYDLRRNDTAVQGLDDPLTILERVAKTCFMPLTWGGRIRSVEDMRARFVRGADKITLNTAAFQTPDLITEGARLFGSQAIVVSIDVQRHANGTLEVVLDGARTPTGVDAIAWSKEAERRGAGELLLQAVERDGAGTGYDVELIAKVAEATRIPVIACSGVGRYEDYAAGIAAGASAVAAANIWHFKDLADRGGKRALAKAGVDVRPWE
jgi:cyclase